MIKRSDSTKQSQSVSITQELLRHALPPALLFLLSSLPLLWDDGLRTLVVLVGPPLKELLRDTVAVTVWITGIWLVSRVLDILLWEGLFNRKLEVHAPQLLKVMLRGLLVLLALMGIMSGVFELPLTGIWATSGAVGLVIGLALQRIITDAFSGLAMNLDHAFSIGDWLMINQRGLPTYIGRVEEITWRTTRILTKDNTTIVLPNSLISQISLINLSRPEPSSRFKITLLLPHHIPTDRALRALEVALHSTEKLMTDPLPKVRVKGITERGVKYELRYWHDPRLLSPSKARSRILSKCLETLSQAGINPVVPIFLEDELDHMRGPVSWDDNPERSLIETSLFGALPSDSQAQIADQLTRHRLVPGTPIVIEGEEGSSMYMIAEGSVAVTVRQGERELRVATLSSGDFFGESSLLMGEARTATVSALTTGVCFELKREAVSELLELRPELVATLTEALERRLNDTSERKSKHAESQQAAEARRGELLSRFKSLFRL